MPRQRLQSVVFYALTLLVVVGCNSRTTVSTPPASATATDSLRQATVNGDWELAWTYSDQVLIEASGEPATLELVAQVAFRTGRLSTAADLLFDASRLDSFQDERRFQAAFTALLAAGRLFDGLDLLRDGVQSQPADNQRRRLLYDLLIATEQHLEANHHREVLIRNRMIDEELLFSTYRYVRRTEEDDSLAIMLERNPTDFRPLIGKAKRAFDKRHSEQAIEILQEIVQGHSEFVTAQVMLGRALVAAGDFAKLPNWAGQLPVAVTTDPDYWLTIGDWALQFDEIELATNAYGQAARRGSNRLQPWNKLAAVAIEVAPFDAAEFALIKKRAAALTKLRQGYVEFEDQNKQSAAAVRQITLSLLDLGKYWEAEAWVAYGTTLPTLSAMEKQSLIELRKQVLSRIQADTPWQQDSVLPTWSWLEPLSPESLVATLSGSSMVAVMPTSTHKTKWRCHTTPPGRPVHLKLQNEAVARDLKFFGRTADDLDEPGIFNYQMIGCGGGTIDFDLDGWPDLYLVTAGGKPPHTDSAPDALFRNLNGRFKPVSSQAGGDGRGFGQGVAVGDVNEDGFDDLLVLNYGPNRLWINNGDGTFADQSSRWLPNHSAWSTSAAIADLDGDGISDLFIANYCAGTEPSLEPCYASKSKGPRTCSPTHYPAQPDVVLRGLADGRFVDVTQSWQASPDLMGRGLGVVAGSFDDDAGIDLLVANDMTTNHYWSRRRSLPLSDSFMLEESAVLRGLATDGQSRSQGSMGIAAADLNQDGVVDFYVTNFDLEHNTLYLSRGSIGWSDQTSQCQLLEATVPVVGFGTQAVDFDNNGEHELIIANGHVDHFEDTNGITFYQQPPQLFQRDQQGVFGSVGQQIDDPYFRSLHVGRGLWTIDANQDGKVDMVTTHQTEPAALLVNQTDSSHAFVTFRLVAKRDARTAVGSVITIRFADREATYLLNSGDGFLCSNERCVHIGLGTSTTPVDVSVHWLDGETQTWSALAVNRQWLLTQDEPAYELPSGLLMGAKR